MGKENSYMELCIHLDGKENVYLRVPTIWDNIHNQWIAFIKTPDTKMLITGKGKDSFELEHNFYKSIKALLEMEGPISEEVFGMFMPEWYWETK